LLFVKSSPKCHQFLGYSVFSKKIELSKVAQLVKNVQSGRPEKTHLSAATKLSKRFGQKSKNEFSFCSFTAHHNEGYNCEFSCFALHLL
jgi:hypothetical protein